MAQLTRVRMEAVGDGPADIQELLDRAFTTLYEGLAEARVDGTLDHEIHESLPLEEVLPGLGYRGRRVAKYSVLLGHAQSQSD